MITVTPSQPASLPLLFTPSILLHKVGPHQVAPLLEPGGRGDGANVHRDEVQTRGVELEGEEVRPDLFVGCRCVVY